MSEEHAHLPRVSKEVREREGKCESEHIYKRLLKDTDGRETEEQTDSVESGCHAVTGSQIPVERLEVLWPEHNFD